MVYSAGLENQLGRKLLAGSNPAPSALIEDARYRLCGIGKNQYASNGIVSSNLTPTASQDFSRNYSPRASLRLGARLPIYIHFWLKKKIDD